MGGISKWQVLGGALRLREPWRRHRAQGDWNARRRPPLAIFSIVRPLATLFVYLVRSLSLSSASSSRSLMSSQFSRFSRPRRHADERPAALQPFAVQAEVELSLLQPFMRVVQRLPGAAVPQHDRAAAQYRPSGSCQRPPYSRGWSSTCTASRFSPGSRLGPRVTAQLFRTPSSSRRKS